MKILIVNETDIQGGAARAAYRLHKSLIVEGVDSQMLVQSKTTDDYTVIGQESMFKKAIGKLRPILDNLPLRIYKDRTKVWFSPSWLPFSGIVQKINEIDPDIVHLHWVNGGMMRIEEISKINAPIVWSLHDMWPFTGGCHYDNHCGRFKKSCGYCPVLGSEKKRDLSARILSKKNKEYSKIKSLTVVGLSRWIAQCAKSSILFTNRKVVNLPNPINTDVFKPFEQSRALELLGLPKGKKIILFGAMGGTSDQRKGFAKLSRALKNLESEKIELVIFGSCEPKKSQGFKQKAHYLGHIHDDVTLCLLYNSADVMIVPSIQENLSNAIMESLACGTPVVGFDIGGNCDMIDHKENGYLAKSYDVMDLSKGINYILDNPDNKVFANNAREKVMSNFDSKIVSKKFIELYNNILSKSNVMSLL